VGRAPWGGTRGGNTFAHDHSSYEGGVVGIDVRNVPHNKEKGEKGKCRGEQHKGGEVVATKQEVGGRWPKGRSLGKKKMASGWWFGGGGFPVTIKNGKKEGRGPGDKGHEWENPNQGS